MTDETSPSAADINKRRKARFADRRDRSREDILDAARDVVLEKGVASTTLAAVARAAGMSKTALYYYFPSKDALLFDLMFRVQEGQANDVALAVADADSASEALGALIRTTVTRYAGQIDDFHLAFLYNQIAAGGRAVVTPEQLQRMRPLNDLVLSDLTDQLGALGENRAGVKPRLFGFLALLAAIGLLTVKGTVEAANDPLLYSDDEMIDALIRIFSTAAEPVEKGPTT